MSTSDSYDLYEHASKGRYFEVQSLLNKGVHPDAGNSFAGNPLMEAAQRSHKEVVELLINAGANVHKIDEYGNTLLHHAANKGWVETVRLLANKGAKLDSKNEEDETPLISAAQKGHAEVVQQLISSGAEMQYRDGERWTALHHAAYRGSVDVVQCFLNAGVDLNDKDSVGQTPMMLAAQNSHQKVIDLLYNAGADMECHDDDGCTLLHHATSAGANPEVVQYLLTPKKVALNVKNSEGETALHFAVHENETEMAKILMNAGADCNLKDHKGESPFSYLVRKKMHPDLMRVCIEKGAYVTDADYKKLRKDHLLKFMILQDAKVCTQAVINKFNNKDLPYVYQALGTVPVLPPIEQLRIGDKSGMINEIERAVAQEIRAKRVCNLTKIVPSVLSILCVKAVMKRLPPPPPFQVIPSTSRSGSRRPGARTEGHLYKRLCTRKWCERVKLF